MTSPAWLNWSRDDAEAYARNVGLDAEAFAAAVASAQGGDADAKIRLSEMLGSTGSDVPNQDVAAVDKTGVTTGGIIVMKKDDADNSPLKERAAGAADPAPGPRDLEALIEPLRVALTRETLTPLSLAPELAALADRVTEAGITPVERAAVVAAALEAVKAVKITDGRSMVLAALQAKTKPNGGKALQGGSLTFDDPDPWDEPVDGAVLLKDLMAVFCRFLVLPDGADAVLSLWVTHTYALDATDHAPYLAIVSPTKRCGKTTATTIARALVWRALLADSVTPAVLFRVIEMHTPTILIDELDQVPLDSEVWPILNSGHSRDGAVLRSVGDEHETRSFSTFSAKLIAYIRKAKSPVPDTLEDRSIRIVLQRKRRSERRERLRTRALAESVGPIRRRLMRWAADHIDALTVARPDLPEALDDRAADGWEPLLAIADAVGGEWPELARRLAVSYSAERAEDDQADMGVLLLADLGELIASSDLAPDTYGYAASRMAQLLHGLVDRPWSEWGRSRQPITTTALGRLLRPHGARPKAFSGKARRYPADDLHMAIERMAPTDTHITPPSGAPTRHPVIPDLFSPASDSAVRGRLNDGLGVSEHRPMPPKPLSHKGDDGMTGSTRHKGGGGGMSPPQEDNTPDREPGEDDDDPTPTGWRPLLDEVPL